MANHDGKTKFTPENRATIIQAVAEGETLTDAAALAGCSRRTVGLWLNKGRKAKSGAHHDFEQRFTAAEQQAADAPKPLTRKAFFAVVSETARKGNTTAQRLYWEMLETEREIAEAERDKDTNAAPRAQSAAHPEPSAPVSILDRMRQRDAG